MRKEGDLMVCTVEELAEFIAEGVNAKEPLKSRIRECDLAILDDDPAEPLKVIQTGVSGWYGVKVVPDLGFDTESLILVADYYGGGCAEFCSVWDGLCDLVNLKEVLVEMLVCCVGKNEEAKADTKLFVELKRYVKGTGLPA